MIYAKNISKMINPVYALGNGLKFTNITNYITPSEYVTLPRALFQNYIQANKDFSISFIINCGAYWNSGNGIGDIIWAINNSNYIGETKGFTIGSFANNNIGIQISNLAVPLFYYKYFNDFFGKILSGVNHFVFTHKAGQGADSFQLYLNGELQEAQYVGGQYFSSDIDYSDINPRIGYYDNDLYRLNDIISDLSFFSKVLSETEIKNLFKTKGQYAKNIAECLAWYDFNEKQGASLPEKKGNYSAGTLVNFPNTSLGAGNAWVDSNGNSITS